MATKTRGAKVPSEDKTITWDIKNFREQMALDQHNYSQEIYHVFEAGVSIGLPTQWKLSSRRQGDNLKICLELVKSPKEVEKAYATFGYQMLGQRRGPFQPPKEFELRTLNPLWLLEVKPGHSPEHFLLADGSLQIEINFTLYKDIPNQCTPAGIKRIKFNDESRVGVLHNFQELLDSGEDSDIKIEMQDGKTLQAHKLILKAQSPVFFAMFQNKMTESCSGVLRIEDVSYDAMKIILKFIYTGEVDEEWEEVIEEIVYTAEKYELLRLKEFCDQNMSTACTPENAYDLLKVAHLHKLKIAEAEIESYCYIKKNILDIIKAMKSAWDQNI